MQKRNKVFVYGTLLSVTTRKMVCGNEPMIKTKNGTLDDYKKVGLNILKDKGSKVEGMILEVTDKQLNSLNHYEGLGYMYKQIGVKVGKEKAIAYQLIEK